jgi:hypothetical protein
MARLPHIATIPLNPLDPIKPANFTTEKFSPVSLHLLPDFIIPGASKVSIPSINAPESTGFVFLGCSRMQVAMV